MDGKTNYFAKTVLFAKEVIECSSQYGEDGRTAFVAENICGPPTIYPNFEDSTRSCSFLSYGTRWKAYPGAPKPILDDSSTFTSTDYVDIFLEHPVIVVRVKIFETFFPGAIVAIRACYRDQPASLPLNARGMYWATLWQSSVHSLLPNVKAIDGITSIVAADSNRVLQFGKSRIFVPDLFNIPLVPTDLIRIELDVCRCAYHTQLDALQVEGYQPILYEDTENHWKMPFKRGIISRKELEWYLYDVEEQNLKKRELACSLPSLKPILCSDDVDDCPTSLLPLEFPMEIHYIQNSQICPISVSNRKLPSLTLMHRTTLPVCDKVFIFSINPLLRLPDVVLLDIFRYLDISSLCRISCVCRAFYRLGNEILSQIKSISLKPFWMNVTDNSLSVLSRRLNKNLNMNLSTAKVSYGRWASPEALPSYYASWSSLTEHGLIHHTTPVFGGCVQPIGRVRTSIFNTINYNSENTVPSRLKRLDLSWCGNYQTISTYGFCQFLNDIGRNLTTLRLASCQMVNNECLLHLINTCGCLEELDLSSCRSISRGGFIPLGRLIKLRWLSLYRTRIADAALHNLANLCQHLRHMNLGSCASVEDADSVIGHLTKNNPWLESLVLWRCRSLTSAGILKISEYSSNLLRLDLSWCTGIQSEPSNCLRELVNRCPKLRVLSLTAIRSVTPADIDAITDSLYDSLTDLDLVGNALITHSCVDRLLRHCRSLAFLDISHCPSISPFEGLSLRTTYHHCNVFFYHDSLASPSPPTAPMDFGFPQLPPPRHLPLLALPGPHESLDG